MPSWTSGSGTWTAPFAANAGNVIVVAGGGGGYRDNAGPGSNGRGGGGGSGGYVSTTIALVSQGNYAYSVGGGGSISGGTGGSSSFHFTTATGGGAGGDQQGGPGGSPGGNPGSGDGSIAAPGNGAGGASAYGGYGAGGNGNRNDKDNANPGGGGFVSIEVTGYSAPTITTFDVGEQTSSGGVPRNDVSISWATQWATSVSISNYGSGLGSSGSDSSVNTGLQSVASSNSPATKSYTLTATGPGGTVSITRTARVYNDNTPSNGWTTSFINLEPNTQVTLNLGTLSGVDMPTTISTSGTGNFVGAGGSFSNSRNFFNGSSVQLRTTTLPFNTDLSGVSSTATFGKENTKTVTVTTPGGSFNVSVTTRAPRIKEDFDYANNLNKYPYEDIDLIDNTPTEYLTSAQIDVDDIEIPMEMKADRADIQINVNGTGWKNVRSM